jgi:hypothetical protein
MGKAIKHPEWTCREGCGRTAGALAESQSVACRLLSSAWASLAEQSADRMLEESSDIIAWTWLALRMIRAESTPVYV